MSFYWCQKPDGRHLQLNIFRMEPLRVSVELHPRDLLAGFLRQPR
jgi:hypothetical protein